MFGSSSWKTQLFFAHPASESDMKSRSRKLATGDMAVTSCHVEEIRKSHGPPPATWPAVGGHLQPGQVAQWLKFQRGVQILSPLVHSIPRNLTLNYKR